MPDPLPIVPRLADILDLVSALEPGASAARAERLLKGYSDDLKFVVFDRSDPRWLVRVSTLEALSRRETEARVLREFHARGVRCPEPLAVGAHPGGWSYLVTIFLPGIDADEALPGLSVELQHRLGLEAGRCLADLHRRPGTETHSAWLERRIRKYRRRVAQTEARSVPFPGRGPIEAFVERHLPLLRESPVRFQHDDFHPGNLLVGDGAFAGVIDFNRCDEGDPVEDFYKVPLFTVQTSAAFARGQIEGYIAASSPPRFWERYHLLLAMNLHGMLVWIREAGRESDVAEHDRRVAEIVRRHDWDNPAQPAWFMKTESRREQR